MSTKDNLKEAFSGESQANRLYLAFAKKADAENLPNVAKLFRAAAAAETVHAHAHLLAMEGVKSTEDNLKEAIEGEGYEFKSMYPKFLEGAKAEGARPAEMSFKYALAVEEIHHRLYQKALDSVESGSDIALRKVFVCDICGNTVYDEPPQRCPICNAPIGKFKEID